LSKTLSQTCVCPLLHELQASQLSGPLAQFQSLALDKAGILKVLETLNSALDPSFQLRDADLEQTFEVWWPRLESDLSAIPPVEGTTPEQRDVTDLLDEILQINREQIRRENLRLEH